MNPMRRRPKVLSLDKRMIGALDSACNRTCSGNVWLNHYLKSLEKAPKEIKDLIKASPESEVFRFGNGGSKNKFHEIPFANDGWFLSFDGLGFSS